LIPQKDASRLLISRFRRFIRSKLWFRPALASLFSISIATGALLFGRVYDGQVGLDISEDSLVALLSIFASSMLSVATFTVAAIVTAASSASASTTPRASRFVLSDATAQTVLSAFIAAFIYSVTSILALKAFHYGNAGRFILFGGLVVIVSFVLVSFINWVDHVMKLGRQSTTIRKLRDAALDSMTPLLAGPLGGKLWLGDVPPESAGVMPEEFGYVIDIDMECLQACAQKAECEIILAVRPGEFVEPSTPYAYVQPASALSAEVSREIVKAVLVEDAREEHHDIRFNIVNLAETADRALSPAVNDPGTAVNIMNVLLEVIARWAQLQKDAEKDAAEVSFDRVFLPPLAARELINDAFTPIARDGAGVVEIGVRLQKVLAALSRMGVRELSDEAQAMSRVALELSDKALVSEKHRNRVREAASPGRPPGSI
jgi:uncharacterized membrane protein